MLDPQVDAVRGMVDETAERIATLGVSPVGTPGALVKNRSWDDYAIGRDDAIAHLGALDLVYQGVIADHREAAEGVEEADPVTHDMLIQHLQQLEQFHWFVRAHLETPSGARVHQRRRRREGRCRKGARRRLTLIGRTGRSASSAAQHRRAP